MVDTTTLQEAERVLTSVVFTRFKNAITSNDIVEIVTQFQPIYQYDQDGVEYLIRFLESQYVTTMDTGISLIDQSVSHDEDWYRKIESDWEYWKDYEQYLINQNWQLRVISTMGSITDNILGLLQDPLVSGDWERRGLVIGHVQSGKTANYIGLITKAADAGYKFIIVIAGIHNNLRTQTQERIDAGFIGRDSRTKEIIGVGQIRPNRATPVTLTTTASDFTNALARSIGMELKSLNKTFILVIKKNATTLSSLYGWLKRLNTHNKAEKITDVPMLLIDDEADNASINTNKSELDPTRINREIRNILNLFRKRCYVGYTATPFANIFIDPDDRNEQLGNNLFPEHFIYSLDAPNNYVGYEKIFLDESGFDAFIREIDDAEEFLPIVHKKDLPVYDLPPSLKKAIRTFILSRAIRNLRGQQNKHSSMLINVSRFVAVQREVRYLTNFFLEQLKKAVRFNYSLPPDKALKDSFISQLYIDFCDEYSTANVKWADVLTELNNAADSARIILVNSRSDEALLYSAYSKEGNALTVIAIGGLSLSRGLTLEGLTISYLYRNSQMYDTLMQMGRWFGYRENYADLCRIYMSDISYGWYCHISEATEELKMQIKRMRRDQKKPIDFGLYVKAHPDTLTVTALNKMYHAENRNLQISYLGKLMETHIVPAASDKTESNMGLLRLLFEELVKLQTPFISSNRSYLFRDIAWDWIHDFVLQFSFHQDMSDLADNLPPFIKGVSDLYPVWDVAYQSLMDANEKYHYSLTDQPRYMMVTQKRTIGYNASEDPRRPASEEGWHVGNKNRFSGNSMFEIGVDKQSAEKLAAAAERKSPIYSDFTDVRGKPLLLLHLLRLVDKDDEDVAPVIPAISLSFPNSGEFRTVEYVVNPVWLKQFDLEQSDSAVDEDDYDFEL